MALPKITAGRLNRDRRVEPAGGHQFPRGRTSGRATGFWATRAGN